MTPRNLMRIALTLVDPSIREWATSDRNHFIWLKIAERDLCASAGALDPESFATYITMTALGT